MKRCLRSVSRLRSVAGLLLAAVCCLSPWVLSGASVLERLQGAWVSDREGTVAASKAQGGLSDERIDKLAPLWGKMLICFDGDSITRHWEGKAHKSRLRVLGGQGDTAVFEFLRENDDQPSALPEHEYYRVEIHDGYFFVALKEPAQVVERFVRVPPELVLQQSVSVPVPMPVPAAAHP